MKYIYVIACLLTLISCGGGISVEENIIQTQPRNSVGAISTAVILVGQ